MSGCASYLRCKVFMVSARALCHMCWCARCLRCWGSIITSEMARYLGCYVFTVSARTLCVGVPDVLGAGAL